VVVVEVHREKRADKLVRKLALAAEQHGTERASTHRRAA
jgi:hypothetical protein